MRTLSADQGLAGAVLLVSVVGVVAAPWLSLLVGAGFGPDKLAMTTRLVRIVFPMTGLLVLCALALGVLNAHRRFFLPYAAPVIWSAAQIAALLLGGSWLLYTGRPLAMVLAVGALIGAALELGLLLRAARPLLGTLRPRFELGNRAVRDAIRRMPGVLLGRGVIQISGYVDTLLVSFLGSGANAAFVYAQMLYLLPMSLLGTGEAAASLPELSREGAEENRERRNALLRARLGSALARVTVLPANLVSRDQLTVDLAARFTQEEAGEDLPSVQNETDHADVGLVRTYEISPGIWGRYEVRKGVPAEEFNDQNQNGIYDPGETFVDSCVEDGHEGCPRIDPPVGNRPITET